MNNKHPIMGYEYNIARLKLSYVTCVETQSILSGLCV